MRIEFRRRRRQWVCCWLGHASGRETPTTVSRALSGKLGKPIELFNGKDLTGWVWREKGEGTAVKATGEGVKLEDVWTVKDGILRTIRGCRRDISGRRRLTDNYVLTVEERHVVKGNGGDFVCDHG